MTERVREAEESLDAGSTRLSALSSKENTFAARLAALQGVQALTPNFWDDVPRWDRR